MSQPTPTKQKLGFRQKLRQSFLQKSSSAAAPQNGTTSQIHASTSAVGQSQSSKSQTQPTRGGYLDEALQRLPQEEQATLQRYIAPDGLAKTIDQAAAAVGKKQKETVDKRWTFSFAGRQIVLRDKADQILKWLDRFKSVGDVAANIDPVHVGLPWAGIRLILEVTVTNANLMATLLIGFEIVLYMTSRLQAYISFSETLLTLPAKKNLEESIVLLSSHILHFLAKAIQIYEKSSFARTISAFWQISDIQDFEKKATELAQKVEIDASNCDRDLANEQLQIILDQVEELRRLKSSIDEIGVKIDLGRIPYAKGAMFDSYDAVHTFCHPKTRVDLLADIKTWAQASDGKGIYWLTGAAGAGKSTISHTLAQWLSEQRGSDIDLGASFFFKRGEGDRGSAARFFPSIVRQLILKIPDLGTIISQVITEDPFIFEKALAEQFRKLVMDPLQMVSCKSILIVVVDALDECENGSDIQIILELWSRLILVDTVRLRLFLTSRPEQPLRLQFRQIDNDIFQNIVLQEAVPQTVIEHDLRIYLRDSFRKIRNQHNVDLPIGSCLKEDWPGDDDISKLVQIARPLFIVAATICRFVGDLEFDPSERLNEILESQSTGQLDQMEMTYLPVLRYLTVRDKKETAQLCDDFKTIVGSIICLAEPLSLEGLAELLGKTEALIVKRLAPLHSVLQLSGSSHVPVRILHLSFAEFLLSENAKEYAFAINAPYIHQKLAQHCLDLLSNNLCEDICGYGHPGVERREVDELIILKQILPSLDYACRYWVHHLEQGATKLHDDGEVHVFLERHFLHWLEALSLINRTTEATALIQTLQDLSEGTRLSALLLDAQRFVLANREIIHSAPLQIYLSATIFAPQTSLVRKNCCTLPPYVKRRPVTPLDWGLELQRFDVRQSAVLAIAYSPNGKYIAVGLSLNYYPPENSNQSEDLFQPDLLRLWDTTTGQEKQSLKGHHGSVEFLEFDPSGSLLVSGAKDQTIRLWHPSTGLEKHTLNCHTSEIRALAVSSSIIASTSDVAIQLFDTQSFIERQPLKGHDGIITSLTFTSDERNLISISEADTNVILWDVNDATILRSFQLYESLLSVAIISPDASMLASGSRNGSVQVQTLTIDRDPVTITRQDNQIIALAFSRDGKILASTTYFGPILLHDVTTHKLLQSINGGHIVHDITFSPVESILASAAADGIVRFWNVGPGPAQPYIANSNTPATAAFSHDGSMLASIGYEGNILIWNSSSGAVQRRLDIHARTLAFACTSYVLASSHSSVDEIVLWDAMTGQKLRALTTGQTSVHSLAFSQDDGIIAISSWENDLHLLNTGTGDIQQTLHDVPTSERLVFAEDNQSILLRSALIRIQDGKARVQNTRFGHAETYQRRVQHFSHDFFDEWLECQNARFLWLPAEFRDAVAIHKDMIALADQCERVFFIEFDWESVIKMQPRRVRVLEDLDDDDNDDDNSDDNDDDEPIVTPASEHPS